jgi:acetyl esterase/lipase
MHIIDWNNRKKTPEEKRKAYFKAILEGIPPFMGPDISFVKRKWLDIRYSDLCASEKLDIYLPDKSEGPFPVLMWVHGGGFYGGSKRNMLVLELLKALSRGYALVAVEYSLSYEAIFPRQIYEIKAAIRWIKANSDKYFLDPDRIALIGDSAGGHLVSLAGTSWHEKDLEDLTMGNSGISCRVNAVVDWFGPIDFLTNDEQFEQSGLCGPFFLESPEDSAASLLMGCRITDIPDLVRAANPETYITGDMPSFLIQHGSKDTFVPVQQSVNFAKKLKKADLDIFEYAGHGGPEFFTYQNFNRIFNFLDDRLSSGYSEIL